MTQSKKVTTDTVSGCANVRSMKDRKFREAQLKQALVAKGCTDFQIEVYLAVARIPKGETRSYGEIACVIKRPKAARAVGTALKRNPFPGERVPCHRVIHASGNVTGFMGSMDPDSPENRKKRRLLRDEKGSEKRGRNGGR